MADETTERTVPFGMFTLPSTPEMRTKKELTRIYNQPVAHDLGFGGKILTAFEYETVTAEALRDLTSRRYKLAEAIDPNFTVTPEIIEEYASDIPKETIARIGSPGSLAAFLEEVNDARIQEQRRQDLYTNGMVSGIAATIIGSGAEAVAATILGAKVAGPFGAAAGAAGFANRITRGVRIATGVRAALAAAAIDVPLEGARYAMDKTLTPGDLMIAVGASGVLSGTLGTAFPKAFSRQLRGAIDDSVREETEVLLKTAGKDAEAEQFVEAVPTIRVVTDQKILDTVIGTADTKGLTGARLDEAAKRLGVPARRNGKRLTADEKREAIVDIIRASKPGEKEAMAALDEALAGVRTVEQLTEVARRFGISVSQTQDAATLRKLIKSEFRQTVRRGTRIIQKPARIARGLKTAKPRVTIEKAKFDVQFSSDVGYALWKLGGRIKSDSVRREIIATLEELGVDDPETLAKELRKRVKENGKQGKGVVGGLLKFDEAEVLGRAIGRQVEEPVDIRIDPSTKRIAFGTESQMKKAREAAKERPKSGDPGDEPHPVADAPDQIILIDGREAARDTDLGVSLIEMSEEAYDAAAASAGLRTVKTARRKLEKAARFVEGAGPKIFGRTVNRGFAAVSVVLDGMEATNSLFYKARQLLMESPRGGGVNGVTTVNVNRDRVMSELKNSLINPRREWVKQGNNATDFDRTVIRSLTDKSFVPEAGDPISDAVIALRRFHNKMFNLLSKNGLLEGEVPDPNTYFRRIYRHTAFSGRGTREEMVDFFVGSMESAAKKRGVTEFNEAIAREAAKRIVDFGLHPTAHRSSKRTVEFIRDQEEQIRMSIQKLADEGRIEGDVEEQVQAVLETIMSHGKNDPHLSKGFQKHRIELDENYEAVLDGVNTHIDHFFNRNLDEITEQYAYQALGAIETKKILSVLGFQNLPLTEVASRLAAMVPDAKDSKFAEDNFLQALRRLSGQPAWEADADTVKNIISVQSLAQGIYGSLLGIAQLPEIMNILARTGFRNALQSLPSLGETMDTFLMGLTKEKNLRGADGRLLDNVAAELETFVGSGGDYARGDHVLRRLDDMSVDPADHSGVRKWIEMGRSASMLNPLGLIPMETFLRRWGTKAAFQRFVNEAYEFRGGKTVLNESFWTNGKQRFRELGLSEEEAARIFKALSDEEVVTVRPGHFGNYKVKDVDFSKIKDQHAYDLLALAMRRQIDNLIQRQTFGELPAWMNKGPAFKLITQYRVFMMASRSKQVAAGIARGDMREAVNLVGSAGLGGLGYTLLTYGRSLSYQGKEREDYLNESLTLEKMIKSGVYRSSYSSYFLAMVDTGFVTAGYEAPIGKGARTTGMASGLLSGTVPFSMADSLISVGTEALQSTIQEDDPWSQKDLRDLKRFTVFGNLPLINQATEVAISNLPIPVEDN